jgi:hypothetical protein
MKKITFLSFSIMLFAACMFMAACNKSGTSPILGKWELRESEGSLAGRYIYPPGNGNILTFDASGNYTREIPGFVNDNEKGSYKIQSGPWPFGGYILAFTTKDSLSSITRKDSAVIADKQLILFPIPTGPDIPDSYYARIY